MNCHCSVFFNYSLSVCSTFSCRLLCIKEIKNSKKQINQAAIDVMITTF